MTKNYKNIEHRKEYEEIVERLENQFSRKHKLMLRNFFFDKNQDIKDFIFNLINNTVYQTVRVRTGSFYCHPNKSRSLGDLFIITKHYYPNLTVDQFFEKFKEILKTKNIGCDYCTTINKRVFSYGWIFGRKDELRLTTDFYMNLKNNIYHAQ